jgi:wyosine [tRNA(Phe)-imidazoG37] synthetase (radical SAM superfamily)
MTPKKETKKWIYGPVPSRRLGYSLGIDCVPFKTCSYDCLYCQLGSTAQTTVSLKPYVSAEAILDALSMKLHADISVDVITLGGSGEPTLNSEIGALIHAIKGMTAIPVAVLTNGSLLGDKKVQSALMKADLVLPSLDAYDPEGFNRINRPHPSIVFDDMVAGLTAFRQVFSGQIWLEVFILKGINDGQDDAERFKTLIDGLHPDKIHVNTAVRPPAEKAAKQVSQETLKKICVILGRKAEIAFPIRSLHEKKHVDKLADELLSLLGRRPCTVDDMVAGLGVAKASVTENIQQLLEQGVIESLAKKKTIFYQLARDDDA